MQYLNVGNLIIKLFYMAPNKVILLSCGSFNPPTNMHLRMFELARDNLNRLGQYLVIGGIISPVHDAYGKKELIPSTYRCEMVKLALRSCEWIQISDWECSQETWSRTRRVLQHHQNMLNAVLNDPRDSPNNNQRNDLENGYNYDSWITNDIKNTNGPVQIKLLCGADLLESFATPGLWLEEDIESIIGQHGIVVITRHGSDPLRFVYESDILTKYQHNITIVTEWITNDISSTKVRRALRRQESVKYLIQDSVIEFIKKHGLYGTTKNDFKYQAKSYETLNVPVDTFILTPSPSDINVKSLNSSPSEIFLNLSPIVNHQPSVLDLPSNKASDETFKTTTEIKFSTLKKIDEVTKISEFRKEKITSPEKSSENYRNKTKVGFSEILKFKEEHCNKALQISKDQESSTKVTSRIYRKLSEKHSKSSAAMKTTKTESEKDESQTFKENLRRSQSDAIMSRKNENRDTISVKIQFTKDGIKVISDKESIV